MSRYLQEISEIHINENLRHVRLSTQRVVGTARQLTVDRSDLLGDVRESLVKEIGALLHHRLEVILGFSSMLPCTLEIFLCAAKLALYTLQAFHGPSIGCHLVKLAVEGTDLLKQLLFELVVRLLDKVSM